MPRLVLAALFVSLAAGLSACDGGADAAQPTQGKIAIVAPLAPATLRARADTLVVDLATHVSAPAGAAFVLETPVPGVSLEGSRLVVAPQEAVSTTLSVRVAAPGYEPARLTMPLVGRSDWCTPLAAGLDPFPYTAGDVVRFSLSARDMPGIASGTVTWNVLERACEYGSVRLTFDETRSTATSPGTPVRTTVRLPPSGALPDVGMFVSTYGRLPRTFSTASGTPATVSETASAGNGLACRVSATADAQGLAGYTYDCSWYRPGMGNGSSLSLTRLP